MKNQIHYINVPDVEMFTKIVFFLYYFFAET